MEVNGPMMIGFMLGRMDRGIEGGKKMTTINAKNINTLLTAIDKKDLDKIVKQQPSIPILGKGFTKEMLQIWLNKRKNYLLKLLTIATETDITIEKDTIYAELSLNEKALADSVLPENEIKQPLALDAATHEKMMEVWLLAFATQPELINQK